MRVHHLPTQLAAVLRAGAGGGRPRRRRHHLTPLRRGERLMRPWPRPTHAVLDAPADRARDDPFSLDARPERALMQAVKDRFDPEDHCNPGLLPMSLQELIDDCVHCGFCLPTCPTYDLWSEEMDSPRGRIVLMRSSRTARSRAELVTHVDRCLGCMACVTACPSGVRYDLLVNGPGPRSRRATRGRGRAPQAQGDLRARSPTTGACGR